jgi:hypothetical protein
MSDQGLTSAERHLVWFLRLSAVLLGCAAPFVFVPMAWMRPIAVWLGLELPDLTLLEYLVRSISLVYAILGTFCWAMSRDVPRYLPLLRFTAFATLVFDAVLIGVDVTIPMPALWTITEAISLTTWTVALLWLVRRANRPLAA